MLNFMRTDKNYILYVKLYNNTGKQKSERITKAAAQNFMLCMINFMTS